MYVITERKNGYQLCQTGGFKNASMYSNLSDSDIERLNNLKENVNNAFSESERQNDEKILSIKSNMIAKTVEMMAEVERQNDQRIKDMLNLIPTYKENCNAIASESNHFSFDLISELR